MRRQFDDPFFADAFPNSSGSDPFSRQSRHQPGSLFDAMHSRHVGFGFSDDMFPVLPVMDEAEHATFHTSTRGVFTRGPGGNGQWVTQSKTTRSINGVKETVSKRTDSNGNEHTTYSYPDGRERYLINGVEQPTRKLSNHSNHSGHSSHSDHAGIPPPPYPGLMNAPNHHPSPPLPPMDRREMNIHGGGPYNSANIKHEHERFRHDRHRERNYAQDDLDSHHKKRWWRGQW